MKKLIVLICMVLCVAVIGSVLAIAVYPANDVTGSIGTDTYLYLTMDSTRGTGVTLSKGVQQVLPIVLSVDSNESGWGTATLTITAAKSDGKSIDKVSIGLYSDKEGTTPITTNVTNENNVITMTGITAGQTVYVGLLLAEDATQTEVTAAGGTLTCTFAKA